MNAGPGHDRRHRIAVARAHARRFIRFGGIGAANSLVDLGLFLVLVELLDWFPILANVTSYLVAVANSYVLNRLITFRDDKSAHGFFAGLLRFMGVGLIGLAISTISLGIFLYFLSPVPAKLLSILVTLFWNYSASWLFVFKDRGPE